jgi:hypothetical protein
MPPASHFEKAVGNGSGYVTAPGRRLAGLCALRPAPVAGGCSSRTAAPPAVILLQDLNCYRFRLSLSYLAGARWRNLSGLRTT